MKVAVTVIAYEASASIQSVLDRIPTEIAGRAPLVLVSDDSSADDTHELVGTWAERHPAVDLHCVHQPVNLGYGGNQKAMYQWAIEHGADVALLLHGDGQYPPEMSEEMVRPIVEGRADAVHGSRMILPGGARRGHMPLDRYLGNKALSHAFNLLSGAHLSEWFSGFNAYRTEVLARTGLDTLPDGFDFDAAMSLHLLAHGARISEVAIPTHYGDEISRVPLLRTGLATTGHAVRYALRRRARGR